MNKATLAETVKIPDRYRRNNVGRTTPGWEQLNIAKLGREIGYSAGYLRNALTGKRACSVKVLCVLAEVFAMPPQDLLTYIFSLRENASVVKARKKLKRLKRRLGTAA